MKLFNYDTKHQQVNGSLDLGELTEDQEKLINKVLMFLTDQRYVDGRYKCLTLAENIEIMMIDEEPHLHIQNVSTNY